MRFHPSQVAKRLLIRMARLNDGDRFSTHQEAKAQGDDTHELLRGALSLPGTLPREEILDALETRYSIIPMCF